MSNESKRESGSMEVGTIIPGLRHPACVWFFSLSLPVAMAVTGCGGGGKTNVTPVTPAITIALGAAPSALTVGQAYQFSATVSNTSNTAVTWTAGGVAGGNSTVGTLSSSGLYAGPVDPQAAPSGGFSNTSISSALYDGDTEVVNESVSAEMIGVEALTFNGSGGVDVIDDYIGSYV